MVKDSISIYGDIIYIRTELDSKCSYQENRYDFISRAALYENSNIQCIQDFIR